MNIYGDVSSYTIGSSVANYSLKSLKEELHIQLSKFKDPLTIIGHSYGAALLLETLFDSPELQSNKVLVLTNWIYNKDWIEIFYKSNSKVLDNQIPIGFRNSTLFYCPYYFQDTSLGEVVLSNIKYNEPLYKSQVNYLKSMDLTKILNQIKAPIVSISSQNDLITPKRYLGVIENALKLPSFTISKSGHFPFVENTKEFLSVLVKVEKMYSP